jgi:hypothetical protein
MAHAKLTLSRLESVADYRERKEWLRLRGAELDL